MTKIILIQPPLLPEELFARGSESSASIIPPLGLAYIAALLEQKGYECRIIDGIAETTSIEQLCDLVQDYDVIGVTIVSTYAARACELIRELKKSHPNKTIIVGGPHVTALPNSMLERGADIEVIGEGEFTVYQLLEHLTKGVPALKDIKGIVIREGSNFHYTGRPSPIDPLDKIPLPARHLLPMHLYRSSTARASRQPSHSLLASRGCPGVCTFCSKKTFGTKVRCFSVERVVEEFFLLRDKFGAKDVAIWDDNFVANQEMVKKLCKRLIEKKFNTPWSVEARIDCVNRSILQTLKNAGCEYIAYGIESGSQRILDYINKRTSKEQIIQTIRLTQEIGIKIRGYFMLGLPSETQVEMEETIQFAIKLDIELASFTLFVPLPATADYRRAIKSGTFVDPEYFYHGIIPEFNFLKQPLYVPEGMSADELLEIHRQAYNRYYFRPKMLLRKLLSIRSFNELWANANAGLTLIRNALSGS